MFKGSSTATELHTLLGFLFWVKKRFELKWMPLRQSLLSSRRCSPTPLLVIIILYSQSTLSNTNDYFFLAVQTGPEDSSIICNSIY